MISEEIKEELRKNREVNIQYYRHRREVELLQRLQRQITEEIDQEILHALFGLL